TLLGRQLVGRAVFSRCFHEHQRTVVDDEVLAEKAGGLSKAITKQPPEPLAADLAARTGQSLNRSLGVLHCWFADRCIDLEPVAYRFDLPERNAGLRHAPRARVHPQEQHAYGRRLTLLDVLAMCWPSVVQRVVNMRDWRPELQLAGVMGELLGS